VCGPTGKLTTETAFADAAGAKPPKLVVGLVGYPNVGKSSTINALLGEKKVSVSSTPGKTKHFQTIHLSDGVVLCDCPGLVFPQFATTRADLVSDGVLPIDQLREHTAPTALVVKRVPREVLEATYGLSIKVRGVEEGGDGGMKSEDLLIPYASECTLSGLGPRLACIGADTPTQLQEASRARARATRTRRGRRGTS
jgi:large subunit GTPase 1